MPVDGEISPMSICHLAIKLGKECYLPAISNKPAEAMEFRRYIPGETPMRRNHFDILEPIHNARHTILPWMPDIVFIPLVGFDTTGNRIGMGKGYYDRTFANIRTRWRKPTLTGLAHSFQQTQIDPQPWDIPLHKVATEKTLFTFR